MTDRSEKHVWRQKTHFRVLPANQGFDAPKIKAVGVDDRLKMNGKPVKTLIFGQSGLQHALRAHF